MEAEKSEDQIGKFRMTLTWTVAILFLTLGIASVFMVVFVGINAELWKLYTEHFSAILGLPCAAFAALFIVLILKESSGKIEFSGLGFTFKGASGQIVLWVLVYLSIAGTIKLLW